MSGPHRRLAPRPNTTGRYSAVSDQLTTEQPPGKRNRTIVACSECQRKKLKCDGTRPVCISCTKRSIHCQYDVAEGVSRFQQAAKLGKKNEELMNVLSVMRDGTFEESLEVLRRIRAAQDLEDSIRMISDAKLLLSRTSQPQPVAVNPLLRTSKLLPFRHHHPEFLFENGFPHSSGAVQLDDLVVNVEVQTLRMSPWTTASADDRFLTHLMNLFWTWDNTVSRIIDQGAFLAELRIPTGAPQPREFCSSFLVNALLAVGCMYLTKDNSQAQSSQPRSIGSRFANEAARLRQEDSTLSISYLQGLTFLWLYEANVGDGAFALQILDEMYQVYAALGAQGFRGNLLGPDSTLSSEQVQATSHIAWGFYTIVAKIELTFSRPMRITKPTVAKLFEQPDSILGDARNPRYHWSPYPMSPLQRRSYYREVFCAECSLSALIEDVLVLTDPNAVLDTSDQVLEIFHRLARWKDVVMDDLELAGSELPSYILLKVTYHGVMLKFFELVPPHSHPELQRLASKHAAISHANAIMAELWMFRAMYTLRHEYWAMQGCFAAAVIVASELRPGSPEVDTFTRACQGLYKMRDYLHLANSFLAAIEALFVRLGVALPRNGAKYLADKRRGGETYTADVRLRPVRSQESEDAERPVVEVPISLADLILQTDKSRVDID